VHHVTAGVDEGPMVGQAEIDVRPHDDEASLAARLLKAEHLLYPRCVAAVARGDADFRQFSRVDVGGDIIRVNAPA
jgi:folate-dependent phosphoribosylglycinamide formyltransferase PurN